MNDPKVIWMQCGGYVMLYDDGTIEVDDTDGGIFMDIKEVDELYKALRGLKKKQNISKG